MCLPGRHGQNTGEDRKFETLESQRQGKSQQYPANIVGESPGIGSARKRNADNRQNTSSNSCPTPEAATALAEHNRARAYAPLRNGGRRQPLAWDAKLAHDAQKYAEHLVRTEVMVHSYPETRPGQGENLFNYRSSDRRTVPLVEVVKSWNKEEELYHGQQIGDVSEYGHFTQVIWPSTTHVGMGSAIGRDGTQFTVARYWPSGNIIGETAYGS